MAEHDNPQSADEFSDPEATLAVVRDEEPALTELVAIHRAAAAAFGEAAATEETLRALATSDPATVATLATNAVRRLADGVVFADADRDYFGTVHVDDEDRTTFVPLVPTGRYQLRQLADPDGAWVLLLQPDPDRPYRVVDRFGRGWLTCHELASSYPSIEGEWTFDRIVTERGPVREVVPPRSADIERMEDALARAGRRAMASVLLALYQVDKECYEKLGHDELLVAGRPGSWESEMLPRLAHEVGSTIPLKRTDAGAVATVRTILHDWIFGEGKYVGKHVEVAETLARVVGRVVDGRGGWNEVADQWLRNGLYGGEVYRLFGTLSRYDNLDRLSNPF